MNSRISTIVSDFKSSVLNSTRVHLLFLVLLLAYVFLYILKFEYRVVGRIGFAMDDAWIHMTVARNFIEGKGWGMVAGRTLSVSTSPTWTLLVALFYYVIKDPVIAVLSLSFICMTGACALCYFLTRTLTNKALLGVVAAVILIFHPVPLWGLASGMELPLVLLVLFAEFLLYYAADPDSKTRRYAVPVALGIAAMTRPELFVLIPLALLDTFRALYMRGTRELKLLAVKTILLQGFIVLLTLAPYFAFNKISSGFWFPTTYYAKTRVRGVGLSAALYANDWNAVYRALVHYPVAQILEIANLFTNSNLMILLLLVPGALGFCKLFGTPATLRGGLLVAAMFLLPYAMGATSPARLLSNHANRYYVIFPAMGAVLSCVALDVLLRLGKQRLLAMVCVFLLIIAPLRTTYRAIQVLATDVDSTELMYRPIGEWIKKNMDPKAVLALNDIGVIAYFADRDFIDIMGLSSPEIWPAIQRKPGGKMNMHALRLFLQEHKVEYVVLSPIYYPTLTGDSAVFEPLMKWSERYPHDRKISPQVLYKCHWPNQQR